MDYVHIRGPSVSGHRASYRLPVADKKSKHWGQRRRKKNTVGELIKAMEGDE